jgi:hypothetical protein
LKDADTADITCGGHHGVIERRTVSMSTRKLIITALLTGLVILIAGAVQLVMIMA